jgi:GMP synthase (glutamine-hydrolysing)
MIHILDFGSRKVPLICGMIESLGYSTQVHAWNDIDQEALQSAKGIVLSGSPVYLTEVDHVPYHSHCHFLKETQIPVLGICFGHQILGILHGAKIYRGPEVRSSNHIHVLAKDPLFDGLGEETEMTEDHTEGIDLPEGFLHLASSASYQNEGMRHPQKKIWGIQFHPEVSDAKGKQLLKNFCSFC